MRTATTTLLLVLLATTLAAQTAPSAQPVNGDSVNSVFLGYVSHHYSSGAEGRETSLEWLRRYGRNVRVLTGGFESSIGDTQWRYGRMGLSVRSIPRTTFYVEGNLGRGSDGTRDFIYRLNRGSVTVEAVKDMLFLEAEEQYIHIDQAKGNVLKGGLVVTPVRPLRLGLSWHKSIDGNIGARYVSGRVDWTIDRTTLMAGFSTGETRPEMFQVFDNPLTTEARESDEFFAGVQVPLARQKLTVVLTSLEFEDFKRRSVVFNWRVPFN